MAYGTGEPTASPLTGPDQGTVLSDAAAWLRDRWADFLALEPKLVDLQHRAAVAANRARERGDLQTANAAVEMIRTLGDLNQLHGRLVARMESVADYVGLGAIAVPVAVATIFSGLALAVLWFFRKVDLQERLLAQLEQGTLTEQGYLDAQEQLGDMPGPVQEAGGAIRWVAIAVLGYLAVQALGLVGGWRENPPLTVFRRNPPEDQLSARAWSLAYRHAEDGQDYIHDFGPGVLVDLEDDGSVRLSHPDHALWAEFET